MRVDKPLLGVAAAVILAAAGAGYYWHLRAPAPTSPMSPIPAATPSAAPTPPDEAARIEHPLPASPAATPLPDLDGSDSAVADALREALGDPAAAQFLVPDSLVRHIVVTVDNLPRQRVPVDRRPVVAVPGLPIVTGDEMRATLGTEGFRRYAPFVDALRHVDMQRVAEVYLRFYPLFQRAYEDLGYPSGYFNDRLVKVIDVLLATPQIDAPIELKRPNVLYVYADPALEALPAGQKLLIRMGPDNAAVIKAKLSELRAIVTVAAPR